ncbi:hypothetical protein ACFQVA_34950 [Actinomadura keratinilytica]
MLGEAGLAALPGLRALLPALRGMSGKSTASIAEKISSSVVCAVTGPP